MISDQYLEEIKNRLKKTTRGQWVSYVEGRDHTSGSSFIMTGEGADRGPDIEMTGATVEDQDFIAHAKEDIANLIVEIERMRES